MTKPLFRVAFVTGLLAVVWVGASSLRSNPLALAMAVLIGAFFLMGARELWQAQQGTRGLERALSELSMPPARLDDWLTRLPPELQHPVRLRVEGERVALPGPTLAPYLAGLLVLLGMLGTFLGMVVTLSGTGVALERATDLQTMRDTLAAPVKGLGLAFGTSVAGVAASAMLGLMSALCRHERQAATQNLDRCIAGPLHAFTRAHRDQEAFRLQQLQAERLPALIDHLQALMDRQDSRARQSAEDLLASQERFQSRAETAYRTLAASVDQTLRQSLADSSRAAAEAIQPAVAATMDRIARETSALHGVVSGAVQQQLDGVSNRFETAAQAVADHWGRALAEHEARTQALAGQMAASLDGLDRRFEQRAAALLDTLGQAHAAQEERVAQSMVRQAEHWAGTLDRAARRIADGSQATAEQLELRSKAMLQHIDQAHVAWQGQLARQAEHQQAAWSTTLSDMVAALRDEWARAGAAAAQQQAQICQTLEETAQRISAQAEAHARSTVDEIARLVQAASEAPRAAAEVVAQLRGTLADSLARDTAMLDERSRIMATLQTLLDAVQHTATEQKAAIDDLVASTAAWLDQAGARFTERADAESSRMETVSAQLTGSAVEVASLGEALGAAVEGFSQTSDRLMAHLQRIDETLGRSIARSDDQLAYYVAQARELIDLSLMSQKQIVDELQRAAERAERHTSAA